MNRQNIFTNLTVTALWLLFSSQSAIAHDPIFSIGPHVLYKGGIETALEIQADKRGDDKDHELGLELVYGLTGELAVGVELPYTTTKDNAGSSSGFSDITIFSKYRFWREDSLGLQRSASIIVNLNLDNGDENKSPPLGNGANDIITGVTYGYEGLVWYHWLSLRYRHNGKNNAGLRVGNKTLIDLIGGWRPAPPVYKEPDAVWLLELNAEFADKAQLNSTSLNDSGGNELFLSPGLFWTYRNYAIKAGIQIPIASNLNGSQDETDYRFKSTFEIHM